MTWIAVVYDVVDKLGELELAGDRNAAQKVSDFDALHRSGDIEGALRFERRLGQMARAEFELLTPLEEADLARLQEDRNRCAHPSVMGSGA